MAPSSSAEAPTPSIPMHRSSSRRCPHATRCCLQAAGSVRGAEPVSTPAPQSTQIHTDMGEASTPPSQPRRWRLIWTAVGVVVVAGVSIAVANPFGGASSSGVVNNSYPTTVTHVRLSSLSAQVTGQGSLTYAAQPDGSPYAVVNRASGTITSLPATGQVIKQGQVLYQVSNSPVILMRGSTRVYRPRSAGDRGPDVGEPNADLV